MKAPVNKPKRVEYYLCLSSWWWDDKLENRTLERAEREKKNRDIGEGVVVKVIVEPVPEDQ